MKTIYISMALFFAAAITANGQEPLQRESRKVVLLDDVNGERISNIRQNIWFSGLSDAQRVQVEKWQTEMQKEVTQLDNQLREKQVRLQTLETQRVANMKAINQNIDEQTKLLAKQMKLKAGYKQKIRTLLNEEQRAQFDAGRGE